MNINAVFHLEFKTGVLWGWVNFSLGYSAMHKYVENLNLTDQISVVGLKWASYSSYNHF